MDGKLNVILIDDEDLVIEDMRELIDWEANGFHVSGYAYNGMQTMKLVRSVCPDIVFMDVSLPDTDGIRLSRQIRELFPDVVIIILSGYMDFSYAQGAVEIGALSYLVKHQMTPSRLLEVLFQARETIEKKRLSQRLGNRLLLRDILEQNAVLPEDTLEHLAAYRDSFVLLLLSPVTPVFQTDSTKDQIRQPHSSAFCTLNEPQMKILDLLICHSNLAVFIGISPEEKAGRGYLARLGLFVRRLLDIMLQTAKTPFFAVHLGRETVISGLHDDFKLLESHAGDYRFWPGQNIIDLSRIPSEASALPAPDTVFLDRENFLSHNQQFYIQLSDCFEHLLKTKDAVFLSSLCSGIRHLFGDLGEEHLLDGLTCTYAPDILPQVQEHFKKIYEEVQRQQQYSPSTNYMIRYIRQNYNLSPSLLDISATLKSSSMYLGQKFKKDTGRTFHDYLNEYRIEQAKELLSKTNMKIFEVSESIGITNSQYFSRIFKEMTGRTPNEYRAEHFSI